MTKDVERRIERIEQRLDASQGRHGPVVIRMVLEGAGPAEPYEAVSCEGIKRDPGEPEEAFRARVDKELGPPPPGSMRIFLCLPSNGRDPETPDK